MNATRLTDDIQQIYIPIKLGNGTTTLGAYHPTNR